MTGAEHFAAAERLLASAMIAAAQVHATLALAAATAEAAGSTCGHGTRGFCMYCVMPSIDDACTNIKEAFRR